MTSFKISQSLIDLYAAGPSQAKRDRAQYLHKEIRARLSSLWNTFLQGSYRNATATAYINDVDVVALRQFREAPESDAAWQGFFDDIVSELQTGPRLGTLHRGDKCITLITYDINVDIVPAVHTGDATKDPIHIYSRRARRERANWPRDQITNGQVRNLLTDDAYKPTVRMLKRWARQYEDSPKTSPGFYIECAAYAVPSSVFDEDLPLSLAAVAVEICKWSTSTRIPTVGGGKDILVPGEWAPDDFLTFQRRLQSDVERMLKALKATSQADADFWWKRVFGD